MRINNISDPAEAAKDSHGEGCSMLGNVLSSSMTKTLGMGMQYSRMDTRTLSIFSMNAAGKIRRIVTVTRSEGQSCSPASYGDRDAIRK